MADAKFGRLFTEMDVKLIASQAAVDLIVRLNRVASDANFAERPSKEDLEAVIEAAIAHEDRDDALTFPADEPLFLLRGQDSAAVESLMRYVHLAEAYGASDAWGDRVRAEINRMAEWQQAHPERVGVPD